MDNSQKYVVKLKIVITNQYLVSNLKNDIEKKFLCLKKRTLIKSGSGSF